MGNSTQTAQRKEQVIDATGQSLGRIATQVVTLLRGKHKASFELHTDCGDVVRVKNVAQISMNAKKANGRIYYSHTGYLGSLRAETLRSRFEKNPARVLHDTVRKMLPWNNTRAQLLKRLIIE